MNAGFTQVGIDENDLGADASKAESNLRGNQSFTIPVLRAGNQQRSAFV